MIKFKYLCSSRHALVYDNDVDVYHDDADDDNVDDIFVLEVTEATHCDFCPIVQNLDQSHYLWMLLNQWNFAFFSL